MTYKCGRCGRDVESGLHAHIEHENRYHPHVIRDAFKINEKTIKDMNKFTQGGINKEKQMLDKKSKNYYIDTRRSQKACILLSYVKRDLDRIIAGGHRSAEGKILINRFRREIGYSLKTVNVDIWNSIEIAYKALDKEEKFTYHHKSKIGIETRVPYKIYVPDYLYPYCKELGCTEKFHHPECALNSCKKKNNNWDIHNAYPTKESAQQIALRLWDRHKWPILFGAEIVILMILKFKGII